MTLYEMLDRAMAHQKVWIFEQNTYDQNMPLFKGTVNDARIDPELRVWDFLMCEVELYDCSNGILDIRVKDGNSLLTSGTDMIKAQDRGDIQSRFQKKKQQRRASDE